MVNNLPKEIQRDYSLKSQGSLKFLEDNKEIVESESSISDCKSRNTQVVKISIITTVISVLLDQLWSHEGNGTFRNKKDEC